jgi:hypothetical protein
MRDGRLQRIRVAEIWSAARDRVLRGSHPRGALALMTQADS